MSHLKTLRIPKVWGIERKNRKFSAKTSPGPHNHNASIPLVVLLRDIMKIANDKKSVKYLLHSGEVLVDGVNRKDVKFPVGLMDVISFPKLKKYYRIVFSEKGRFIPLEIPETESKLKIVMITNKIAVKGGKMQLNLSDGKNIQVTKAEGAKYSTQASLVMELPKLKIKKYLPFEKGMTALVTSGKHVGEVSVIQDLKPFKGPQADRVVMKNKEGKLYDTLEDYAFVVGKTKSEVKIK